MNAHDALLFNLVTIQFFGGVIFTLQLAPAFFPNANIPIAFLLTILFTAPLYIVYSVLATSYPRSGGDYVFISRLVSPMWGFVSTFAAWVAWQWYFAAITPIQMIWEGLAPFILKVAYYTGSSSIYALSSWILTPNAEALVGILILVFSLLLTAFGMDFYVKIQRALVIFAFAAVAIALGILLITTPQSYHASFNSFLAATTGNRTDWYGAIVNTASAQGYNPTGSTDWYQTLGTMVLTMIPLGYGFWSIIVMGEIKDAKVLKLAIYAIYGSIVIIGLFFTAIYILLQNLGPTFYGSFFYLYDQGSALTSQMPFTPNFVTLILIASNNWLVDFLLSAGVFLNLLNLMVVLYIVGSRVMLAQTLDRLLPSKFAELKTRWVTPLYSLLLYLIGSIIFLLLAVYYPFIFFYTSASTAAVLLAYILAAVAAIIFPRKAKDVYSQSAISRYNLAGIPLISIIGVLSLLFSGLLIYFYIAIPSLGILNPIPLAVVIGIYAVLAVYYYINKSWKKKFGIEVDLAFREIPPE
jgi:amino acid transporter